MDDIKRKKMKDIIVPQNDLIRRPVAVPEVRTEPAQPMIEKEESIRIERNPFFKKARKKNVKSLLSAGNDSSEYSKAPINSHALLWAFFVVVCLLGGFAVANYFSSATAEVVPISREVKFDHDFTATKDGSVDELTFKLVSLTEEQSKEVSATSEKKIQKKASGRVVLYNAYNGDSQRLIKNTRIESPDHKIFRIDESVVVPGAKMAGGKVVTPGSVEALVYADVAGKEYNIGVSNFTIPGFRGDPRYTKFTVASRPDSPISGGFSGTIEVPSDDAVIAAREELKQELKTVAIEKVRAQIPADVTFFPGSMIVKFEEVPQDFSSGQAAKVSMRATISVFFFDTELLTQKLVDATVPAADKGKLFSAPNMSTIVFSFVDPVENVVLNDLAKLRFHISGTATFAGRVDAAKIRAALAGKSKKDFGSIIVNQNNIYKADAVIRPMWNTEFPTDPSKITVKIISE